jgi:tetratricopeptide (TPR) repeat protein
LKIPWRRSKVAVLNFSAASVEFSGYVIEELTGILVRNRKLVVVERKNLEVLREEMNFQLSGEVSDESAQAIGKMLGAESIISGSFSFTGINYRFRVRTINVETAEIESLVSLNVKEDVQVSYLLNGRVSAPPARPSSAEAGYLLHYNRACDYYFRCGYDQALIEFTEALRFNPVSADAYAGRGNVYNSLGEYARGAVEYEQAARLNAGYGPYSRGFAYYINQDYDRAIAECSESIRIMPGYVFAYNCRANSYNEKGDKDRAIADYTEAIRINSGFTAAFGSRGQAYRSKGDYNSALADLNEAVRLDPRYTWAYTIRANLYKEKKDYDKAVADYTEVIRLDPKNTAAYQGRGDAYRMKGDYDRAIRDATEALRINARYQWACATRGAAYRAQGNYDKALADLNEAVRLDPRYTFAYEERAKVYEQKGDRSKANADYAEARRLQGR